MNIKQRKIAIIAILILANIVTLAGVIQVDRYNVKHYNLFESLRNISLYILIVALAVYFIYKVILKIVKVRLENYGVGGKYFTSVGIKKNQDILYQWSRKTDTIIYSANIYNKYSIEMIRKKFMKSMINYKNISDEHKQDLLNIMNKLIDGSSYEQIEVKLKTIDGKYAWVRISGTAVLNRFGELTKIVGVVTDIDEEKRKNEELIFKAERDSLTKLYNRGKFIELVNEYLNGVGKNKKSYLAMIDVDNFKIINDNLGHIYGDKALISLSNSLKGILNKDELIGRIGGDELCIFIEGSHDESYILKRADEIMNIITSTCVGKEKKINISASIGISQYPKDGKSFEELYIKSDKAMYKAKEKGKGRYIIYDED